MTTKGKGRRPAAQINSGLLRSIRARHNLKLRELAKKSGVSPGSISAMEGKEDTFFYIPNIEAVAKVLDIRPSSLILSDTIIEKKQKWVKKHPKKAAPGSIGLDDKEISEEVPTNSKEWPIFNEEVKNLIDKLSQEELFHIWAIIKSLIAAKSGQDTYKEKMKKFLEEM